MTSSDLLWPLVTLWHTLASGKLAHPSKCTRNALPSRVTWHDLTWPCMTYGVPDLHWHVLSHVNALFGHFHQICPFQTRKSPMKHRFFTEFWLLTSFDLEWHDIGYFWHNFLKNSLQGTMCAKNNFCSMSGLEIGGVGKFCPPLPGRRILRGLPGRVLTRTRGGVGQIYPPLRFSWKSSRLKRASPIIFELP